jgi:RHS repeat-associated protein
LGTTPHRPRHLDRAGEWNALANRLRRRWQNESVISKRSGVVEETLSRTFSAGRLTSSNDTAYTAAETFAYDSAGRVSTITYPGGERLELTYDARSRVVTDRFIDELDATLDELHYSYDSANRVSELRRGPLNQLILKYIYTNGFLTETQYQNGLRRTATPSADFGLPDATVTVNASAQTIEDTHNDLNPVLILKSSSIAGNPTFWETYGLSSEWRAIIDTGSSSTKWDAVSNVREMAGREHLYNPEKNRLTQIRDIAAPQTVRHTYTYDAAGFVTNRDGVPLAYDATGAIASIGTVAAFESDLHGRPVLRTLNGVTKHFRFGGAIAYSNSGTPLEMDLGEVVLNMGVGSNRFRHADFRGNVMFVTKGNGTVDGFASYRGFGRMSASGALGDRGFAGGFEIQSLGLVVLGPRVLDSDAGRFLSQDPVFNDVSQYAYTQGNPVYFWDPTGRISHPTGGLDGLNLGGLGSLNFNFEVPSFVGGLALGSGGGPGGPGRRDTEKSEQEQEAERLANQAAGVIIMVSGLEVMAVGFEAIKTGVRFSSSTRGLSAVGGTLGGGFLVIIGGAQFVYGYGLVMESGAGPSSAAEAR